MLRAPFTQNRTELVMQLTRSSSDPMAIPAQPFWQQRKFFTPQKEMPCDKDRKPTERDEAGSISSSDQEAALSTGSAARGGLVLLFLLT
jgi:hypothetical protein